MSVKTSQNKEGSLLSKTEDGTIELLLTIPREKVSYEKEKVLEEEAKEVVVPGFRKGNVPKEIARKHLSDEKVFEHALGHLLPKIYSDSVVKHNLKPIMYPKFELTENTADYLKIKAFTCELPEIKLGDYKKSVPKVKKETPKEEREQLVFKSLLQSIKITIPSILINEEVNSRLSSLLQRIEKLGLNLESYLASIGKNPESLRKEYEEQSRQAIALELILNKIAEEEKIEIKAKEIEDVIEASKADPQTSVDNPNQRRLIESVLKRRAILDSLVSLM